jgi:hypothetical protein
LLDFVVSLILLIVRLGEISADKLKKLEIKFSQLNKFSARVGLFHLNPADKRFPQNQQLMTINLY